MKARKLFLILLLVSANAFAQSKRANYKDEELLKFPVEAAYYLNTKDDYSLYKFLNNQMKLKLDNNSINNFSIFTQTLDGSYDFDGSITFYSLIVDKRGPDAVIQSWYLKTKGRDVIEDKTFYDYLDAHPRAIRMEKGFALLIGGESMKNLDSQKAIIGIIPDYLSNSLQYKVFFLKNDNSLSLNEILNAINF